MFGGYGVFAPNGGMFAGIVTDDQIILKLQDETARGELVAEGGRPWVYEGQGQPMTMSSWIVVPEAFLDDLERFGAWARRAHALVPGKVAKRRPAPKRAAPPKRKAAPSTKRAPKARAPAGKRRR